ncbi:hypothetical protein ACEPPN_002862 [Leptodophora sp. 'Broadleaf-Isolate-01']
MKPSADTVPTQQIDLTKHCEKDFDEAASISSTKVHTGWRSQVTGDPKLLSKRRSPLRPQRSAEHRFVGGSKMGGCLAPRKPQKRGLYSQTEALCKECRTIDLATIFNIPNIAELDDNSGHLVRALNHITNQSGCKLCRFFRSVVAEPELSLEFGTSTSEGFGLFAFSCKTTLNMNGPTSWVDPVWLAVLPRWTRNPNTGNGKCAFRSWERRGLPFIMSSTRTRYSPSGRLVQESADFTVIKEWLAYCTSHHSKTCRQGPLPSLPGFRVIDCISRNIRDQESVNIQEGYITLSYVWGAGSEWLPPQIDDLRPGAVSRVIENAMEVTVKLGFRFLWVDRYCIPQSESPEKQKLLNNMGTIYQNSAFTIIASAGDSPSYGLPGVAGNSRTAQYQVMVGRHKLVAVSTNFGNEILQSEWNKRGWTYQEALLSCRQLVFTNSQVYFQCQGMTCFESMSIPLKDLRSSDDLIIPRFLPDLRLSCESAKLQLSDWISEFLRRSLSKETDALNAFSSILTAAKQLKWIRGNICGIPIFAADNIPVETLANSLLWEMSPAGKLRRRRSFPSWTWLGWRLFAESQFIQLGDAVDLQIMLPLTARFEFDNSSSVPWETGVYEILDWSESNLAPRCIVISGWVFDFELRATGWRLRNQNEDLFLQIATALGLRQDWNQGPYKFTIHDISGIINTSQEIGLSISDGNESYHYAFLCLKYSGQSWMTDTKTAYYLYGLVLTRCPGQDTFERLNTTAIRIEYDSSLGPIQFDDPDPVLGWRKEDIQLV